MTTKIECTVENAPLFRRWIAERGGIAHWQSANLSNPGASWSTPALTPDGQPYPKPTWQAKEKPAFVVTAEADVDVFVPREVKRFHVAVQRGSGLSVELTAASSRKVRAACAKAGDGAFYRFDYAMQEAVIYVDDKRMPLNQWQG